MLSDVLRSSPLSFSLSLQKNMEAMPSNMPRPYPSKYRSYLITLHNRLPIAFDIAT
jgi:hypothetical protein